MKKQTAGREFLGDFAPKFAELNDDVLFGEVWSREDQLDLKTRSIITVTALMSKGILDESLRSHLINAKKNGVSKDELVEVITHVAFYAGWPNAWAYSPCEIWWRSSSYLCGWKWLVSRRRERCN